MFHSTSNKVVVAKSSAHLKAIESLGNFEVSPKLLLYSILSKVITSPSVANLFFSTLCSKSNMAFDTLFLSTKVYSTVSKPKEDKNFSCSDFNLKFLLHFTKEKAKKLTFLSFVISLLSCLTVPLHKFRGFLYFSVISKFSFIFSKSSKEIRASPRIISSSLKGIFKGIFLKTLQL